MHAKPCGHRADQQKRHPYKPRVLQEQLLAFGGQLRATDDPAEQCHRDDQRNHELGSRHAQIAQPRIHSQCKALLGLGIEERDIGHRRGEIAATEATQNGNRDEVPVRGAGVLHRNAQPDRGNQQRSGGNCGPAAATEHGHHKRIENAQGGAGQRGQRRQPEQLIGIKREAHLRQADGHRRKHLPDGKRQQQCRDGDSEVAIGDPVAGPRPERSILGMPLLNHGTDADRPFSHLRTHGSTCRLGIRRLRSRPAGAALPSPCARYCPA